MRSDRSGQGLDWLNFFVANVQTGFGPFIAVFLASQAWTQGEIGLALSIGTLTSMACQVPAGAAVDAARSKRGVASFAVIAIAASALAIGALPFRLPVVLAEILHGVASCLLGPAVAALSLSVAKRRSEPFGERLGRNARFASIGSGCAAGLMGGVGYWLSERAVLFLAALLVLPALLALRSVREAAPSARLAKRRQPMLAILLDTRLITFCGCCAGFYLANTAIFSIAAVQVTREVGRSASWVIAACLIGPQVLVGALSPRVGQAAERWGRRPVLLLGFVVVPLRAALFGVTTAPVFVIAIQVLDGVSGAVLGVLLPLVVADLSAESGRFNTAMGSVGLAIGGAAALSTEIGGVVAERYTPTVAFDLLAAAGVAALLLLWLAMPETKPVVVPGATRMSGDIPRSF